MKYADAYLYIQRKRKLVIILLNLD